MKSISIPFIIITLVALFLLCVVNLKVNAQQTQEDRKVSSFENIVIESSANTYVYVTYDKAPGVVVKTDQRFINKIKTTVSGGTLTINFNTKHSGDVKVEVYVHLPVVKKVSIVGGGQVEVRDGFHTDLLQADIQGGGSIRFKELADINDFHSKVAGGGYIDALKLRITKATVKVSGGGDVLLQVTGQLEGNIAGGGNILYDGDPDVSSNVAGGGRIAKR